MPLIYSQTITRLRAPRFRDDAGSLQPTRDFANATTVTIPNVSVQPVMTDETRDNGGVLIIDEWKIFGPRGVDLDLTNGDRVLWDGRTLDVIGEPQAWPALLGPGFHHSEVTCKASPPTRLGASGVGAVLHDEEVRHATTQQTYTP